MKTEIVAMNLLVDRVCKACKYFGNNTLYSDEDLACCDFCKNSKRQNYECPEERTCEFWETNERI